MSELGQLIISGISGTSLSSEEEAFLEKENIGGVILFADNYESPAQLAELVNHIQRCRKDYPLFIAADQEGGRVVRFKKGFSKIPSMREIGLSESPKLAFHIAKMIAEELMACGVNLNLGPVCDILTNKQNQVIGDRSFGNSEEEVTKYLSSFIRGFQTSGMMSCAKHFPGHGDTLLDSHFDLPTVEKSIDELKELEFKPFIKAIKSRVPFIMMAHLLVPSIDENLPSSLSKSAYDILRKDLRYTGLIITDDMEMKAITEHFSYGEAAIHAIKSGADIVEYKSMEKAKEALEALKSASRAQSISADLLKTKTDRVLETKKSYLSEYKPIYIPEIGKKMCTPVNTRYLNEVKDKASLKKS